MVIVFNATFKNISVISWRSVLCVEETGWPGENHRPVTVTDKLYYIMLYTSPWSRFELTTSVVVGTDSIGNCKSNYNAITSTTTPHLLFEIFKIKLSFYVRVVQISFSIWNKIFDVRIGILLTCEKHLYMYQSLDLGTPEAYMNQSLFGSRLLSLKCLFQARTVVY